MDRKRERRLPEAKGGTQESGGFRFEAEVADSQVDIAKRYPRNVKKIIENVTSLATMSAEVAEACLYVLPPRGDEKEPIIGGSIRLAELIAAQWTNLRIAARVKDDSSAERVVLEGAVWDMERNNFWSKEYVAQTTGKHGPYSDNLRKNAMNAGMNIAVRNCIFQVVPEFVWGPAVEGAKEVVGADRIAQLVEEARKR